MVGARISGQLLLARAAFDNTRAGIYGDGLQAGEDVAWRDGTTVAGTFRLPAAHICGQLDLSGARLVSPGGWAMAADGVQVDHEFLPGNGFHVEGEVRLKDARIGGTLWLGGAEIINAGRRALNADGLHVGRDLLCGRGFVSEGAVHLMDSRVRGRLDLAGAAISVEGAPGLALDLERSESTAAVVTKHTLSGRHLTDGCAYGSVA